MALTQVTSAGLKDGEIVNADLHSAASVALSKLASTGALGSAVTATTQSASDDSTKIATTAFVQAAVTSLIDGAPGSLNTLNELAAAINDDSSYATTLTTALATKLPLAGGTLTGELTIPTWLVHAGDSNTKFGFEGPDTITFEAGGNERLRITTSEIEIKNDASRMLNLITTSGTGSCYLSFSDSGGQKGYVGYGSGGNEVFYIVQNENAQIQFYSNGYTRAFLNADGKFNFDRYNATAGLGRIEFGASGEQYIEGYDTGNGGSGSYLRFGDGNGERLRITADGEIQCRGAADNKGFAVYLDGTRRVSELIEHSSDGELRLYTGEATPVLRTVLTSYGNSYINASGTCNVGIGTSSPDNTLHLLYSDSQTYNTDIRNAGLQIENNNGTDNTYAQIHLRTGNSDAYLRAIREGSNLTSLAFLTDNGGSTGDAGEAMRITSGGVIQTGSKTITGGNNLAIQNFVVKGIWSGSPSIGKSIELISGYDGTVKMAAIGYNLTDTNTGSTYGGDLTFHTQPLYSSPTTPIPESMRISSSGYVTKLKQPSFLARAGAGRNNVTGAITFTSCDTAHNVSGSYNTSNSRFTAPVAGWYHFGGQAGYKETGDNYNIKFMLNGSYQYEPGRVLGGGSDDSWLTHSTASWSQVVKLSANDYVELNTAYEMHQNANYSNFWGYLIK